MEGFDRSLLKKCILPRSKRIRFLEEEGSESDASEKEDNDEDDEKQEDLGETKTNKKSTNNKQDQFIPTDEEKANLSRHREALKEAQHKRKRKHVEEKEAKKHTNKSKNNNKEGVSEDYENEKEADDEEEDNNTNENKSKKSKKTMKKKNRRQQKKKKSKTSSPLQKKSNKKKGSINSDDDIKTSKQDKENQVLLLKKTILKATQALTNEDWTSYIKYTKKAESYYYKNYTSMWGECIMYLKGIEDISPLTTTAVTPADKMMLRIAFDPFFDSIMKVLSISKRAYLALGRGVFILSATVPQKTDGGDEEETNVKCIQLAGQGYFNLERLSHMDQPNWSATFHELIKSAIQNYNYETEFLILIAMNNYHKLKLFSANFPLVPNPRLDEIKNEVYGINPNLGSKWSSFARPPYHTKFQIQTHLSIKA